MYKIILIILIFNLLSTSSNAYIGPGMGGGLVAATLGIIVAIIAAIFGLIWFPLKSFFNKRKQNRRKID